jgi:hypothetical protein
MRIGIIISKPEFVNIGGHAAYRVIQVLEKK